jgi:hypothetical protein
VQCVFAPSGDVAAARIMNAVRKWKGSTAILAFKCEGSHFVERTFAALTKPRRLDEKMQPLSVTWDPSEQHERNKLLSQLPTLPELLAAVVNPRQHGISEGLIDCWERCARRARRAGEATVRRDDLLREVRRELHIRRAFAAKGMRRVLTTIHSAKNQEWQNVVVLWSAAHFKVATPDALKRRLLYNAVTRARVNCLIIADGTAHKWANDPTLSLLSHPTQDLVDSTRPKNPGARRRRRSTKKAL